MRAASVTEIELWHPRRAHWIYAADPLLKAGTSGKREDIEQATMQARRAPTVEGWV